MQTIESILSNMDKFKEFIDFYNNLDESIRKDFMNRFNNHIMDYMVSLAIEGNYKQAHKIQELLLQEFKIEIVEKPKAKRSVKKTVKKK